MTPVRKPPPQHSSFRSKDTTRVRSGDSRQDSPTVGQVWRTCIGCGRESNPPELVRLVVSEEGTVAVDARGGSFGRGAHVHSEDKCLEIAAKRGLARTFRREFSVTVEELRSSIAVAYGRRLSGLLSGALRAKHAAIGVESTLEAIREQRCHLLILAEDALAAARRSEILSFIAHSRWISWPNRQALALGCGRPIDAVGDGIVIVAILDSGLSDAMFASWSILQRATARPTDTSAQQTRAEESAPPRTPEAE